MSATEEILNPPGAFKDMSRGSRLFLAYVGMLAIVLPPLMSPLLFTSAYEYWNWFYGILFAAVLLYLAGVNITWRKPNSFFIIAAIFTPILGLINLLVTNQVEREVLLVQHRYDSVGLQQVSNNIAWQNFWIVVAVIFFVLLFLALEISLYVHRSRYRREQNRPRYRAELYAR